MTHGEKVKAAILAEGLALWRLNRHTVSARRIGARLDMTHGNVLYHFRDAAGLHDALAAEAVRINDVKIMRQLIAEGHAAVASVSPDDRRRIMAGC